MNDTNKKPSTATPPPPPKATQAPTPSAAKPTPNTATVSEATNGAAAQTGPTVDQPGGDSETNEDKKANRSKLFIVVGEVHEFTSAAQAEKFLNQPDAPGKFTVIRGHKIESKQRVSLRG